MEYIVKEKIQKLLEITKDYNLLYVEDNQEARESTSRLLGRFFTSMTLAVDGQDGFEKLVSTKNFDLIITDINMPRLNGIQMIEKVREVDSDVLIIILSAHNEQCYYTSADKLNVSSYITKPVKLPLLIETLLSSLTSKESA